MAQVDRVEAALGYLGEPLAEQDREQIKAIAAGRDTGSAASQIEAILDKYVLAVVTISPESRVDVKRGPGSAGTDSGWHPIVSGKGDQPTGHHRSSCSEQPQQRPGLHHLFRRPRAETASDCIRRGPTMGGYFLVRPSSAWKRGCRVCPWNIGCSPSPAGTPVNARQRSVSMSDKEPKMSAFSTRYRSYSR